MQALKTLLLRLISFAQRHPGLLAAFGFISGLASFVLIERSEQLAQGIALMMLVSWIWLTLEQTLRQGVLSRFGLDLPPALIRFATQMVHQESFSSFCRSSLPPPIGIPVRLLLPGCLACVLW